MRNNIACNGSGVFRHSHQEKRSACKPLAISSIPFKCSPDICICTSTSSEHLPAVQLQICMQMRVISCKFSFRVAQLRTLSHTAYSSFCTSTLWLSMSITMSITGETYPVGRSRSLTPAACVQKTLAGRRTTISAVSNRHWILCQAKFPVQQGQSQSHHGAD